MKIYLKKKLVIFLAKKLVNTLWYFCLIIKSLWKSTYKTKILNKIYCNYIPQIIKQYDWKLLWQSLRKDRIESVKKFVYSFVVFNFNVEKTTSSHLEEMAVDQTVCLEFCFLKFFKNGNKLFSAPLDFRLNYSIINYFIKSTI